MGSELSCGACDGESPSPHGCRPEATELPAETAARLVALVEGFERRLGGLRAAADSAVGMEHRLLGVEARMERSADGVDAQFARITEEIGALRLKIGVLEAVAASATRAAPATGNIVQLTMTVKRKFEHCVPLLKGETLAWHWACMRVSDRLDFNVSFTPSGLAAPLSAKPIAERMDSASGAFAAPCDGTLALCFDASFSIKASKKMTLTLTRGATTGAGARTSAVDAVGAVENASRDNRAAKPQTATSSWVVGKNSPPRVALALLC